MPCDQSFSSGLNTETTLCSYLVHSLDEKVFPHRPNLRGVGTFWRLKRHLHKSQFFSKTPTQMLPFVGGVKRDIEMFQQSDQFLFSFLRELPADLSRCQ